MPTLLHARALRHTLRHHLIRAIVADCLVLPGLLSTAAQTTPAAANSQQVSEHRLVLVLPFENDTRQVNLDWIGEAVPEILNQRLASAGFLPIGRLDRQYALDHLGLPVNVHPTHATAIRVAQTLDVDYIILGSYTLQGQRITTHTQIVSVNALRMGQPLQQEADLPRLLDLLNSTAWRVVHSIDPQYKVPESTFVAASANLRLDEFENYIRGLVGANAADRIRHLKDAVQAGPRFSAAWLALGQAYFANQQYDLATSALGHLPKTDPNALYAEFYRGLSFFYTGNYAKAEDAFGFVADQLPLSEVLNNEGVAKSRRGQDGSSLFRDAIANNPSDPDYSFNLAVSLDRKGDHSGAITALKQALKLRPQDSEATAFEAQLSQRSTDTPVNTFNAAPESHALAVADPNAASNTPLERIKRSFSDSSFRQAAFTMEQMQTMRLAGLPPAQHAAALTQSGQQYLSRGLLVEAERQFQEATTLDDNDAAAHAGLAEIRERSGESEAARREAQSSIKLKPNPTAYIVLARVDLSSNQASAAASDIQQALALDPANSIARTLQQTIQNREKKTP